MALAFYYLDSVAVLVSLFVFFLFLFMLRDPKRIVPSLPLAVVSPVQGKVVKVEQSHDPWLTRQARRVRIRMSNFDIYSLRSPIEGKVVEQWLKKHKVGGLRCCFAFCIRTDEGDEVVVEIGLGLISALFFRVYIQSGQRLGQGQRCGYLCFGGVIADVFMPMTSTVEMQPGQAVTSGTDVLAQIVHKYPASMIDRNDSYSDGTVGSTA